MVRITNTTDLLEKKTKEPVELEGKTEFYRGPVKLDENFSPVFTFCFDIGMETLQDARALNCVDLIKMSLLKDFRDFIGGLEI